ncbi:peroxiredoxin [Bacillus oleivorans]|uniref:Peroxiredoxin n=1 Tax=Bacillus oleivorans TaxID=1448271 RepID=A0A285D798_9BACI|nr:TlpA disulfide reductase family protein [Bacillus oleivorans]SNX75138.1 peroxiredoxin [Bacillus oleivorans]
MFTKYIPVIIIGLLVIYVVIDFTSDNNTTEETSGGSILNNGPDIADDKSLDINEVTKKTPESPIIEYATDFELASLDGNQIKLSDLKGKIVILNFWATWCPPCKAEMPHLQNFYEDHKNNDIEILAVNLTNLDDGEEVVKSFVTDYGLTFPVLLDTEGDVGMTYETFTIPTSYILDQEGRIFQKVVGPMDEQMLNDIINAIPK